MFSTLNVKTKHTDNHIQKKKKHLRIISSEDVPSAGRNRERNSNEDLDRKLSSYEIVTVYDENERDSGSSDKKYKADQNHTDKEDDRIKKDEKEKDKVEKENVDDEAKDDKENKNVDNEVKDMKNLTEEDQTKKENVDGDNKDKKDMTGPDETDKPGASGT